MCTGRYTPEEMSELKDSTGMINTMQVHLSHLLTSPWNRDYGVVLECAAKVFSWDKDMKQLPPVDWERNSLVTSNTIFNDIMKGVE